MEVHDSPVVSVPVEPSVAAVEPAMPSETPLKRSADTLSDPAAEDQPAEKRVKIDELPAVAAEPEVAESTAHSVTSGMENEPTAVNSQPDTKDETEPAPMEVVEAPQEPQESVSTAPTITQPSTEQSPEPTVNPVAPAAPHDSGDDGEYSRDVSQDVSMMSVPETTAQSV